MLHSIHNTATDRRCARSHSNTLQLIKKLAQQTTRFSSLVCIGCSTTLQNSVVLQDKTPKASPKKQSIVEYLPGLPLDTKPLRSCSGNRAKMLLKSHLWIKCHTQYNQIIRFLHHSSANSCWGWLRMNCAWPADYHSLSLNRIQFHPSKFTPFTNLAEVTAKGLCYCNSSVWGWHNSYQSGISA